MSAGEIFRPDGCRQTVFDRVGVIQNFVFGVERRDCYNGTENFFLISAAIKTQTFNHRRRSFELRQLGRIRFVGNRLDGKSFPRSSRCGTIRKRNHLGKFVASSRFTNAVWWNEAVGRRARRRIWSVKILYRREKCLYQDKLLKFFGWKICLICR